MDETLKLYMTTQRQKKLFIRRKEMASCGNGGCGVNHLFFGIGSQVEVSSDDEGFRGSWYVAIIVEIDDNAPPHSSTSNKKRKKMGTRYLVEYATLLDDGDGGGEMSKKPLKEYVEASFMRPLPPPTETQHIYEVNDVVDGFHRDGWWTGVVKGVVEGGSKFLVFFQNPPEEVEFARFELRVHYDWVDCKWVRAEKKAHFLQTDCTFRKAAMSVKGLEGQSIQPSETKIPQRLPGKSSAKCMENKKKHVIDRESNIVKEIIEPKSGVNSPNKKRGRPRKVVIENPTGEEKNGVEGASYEMVVKDCASNEAEQLTVAGNGLQGILGLNHGYPSQPAQSQYNIMDNMLDFRLAKIDNQISASIAEKSVRKPKSWKSKKRNQRRTNNKSSTQDSEGACRKKPSEGFEDRPQLMWYEGTKSQTTVDDSKTQDACIEKASKEFEDRSQMMWREERNSPSTVDDSKISLDLNVVQTVDASSDRQDESAMQSPVIGTADNKASQRDKNSPFEKLSPIWGTLERMELFQKMPQQPHFTPLLKCKEDSREGLAIGHMVIFCSVVEKTSKLQISDPRSVIDSSLETLSDLETHGFHVDPIRHRLNELLSKKEYLGELLKESEGVEMKIAEQCREKQKISEDIREIKKKMEELQEKLDLATSMEKMTDYEIDDLKSKINVIDQDLQNAQHDFERLAAAPW